MLDVGRLCVSECVCVCVGVWVVVAYSMSGGIVVGAHAWRG